MTHMLKKTLCLYLAWALVFFTFPVKILSQNPERIPVAILDLEGRGISALEAATLTDRLRSEMVTDPSPARRSPVCTSVTSNSSYSRPASGDEASIAAMIR